MLFEYILVKMMGFIKFYKYHTYVWQIYKNGKGLSISKYLQILMKNDYSDKKILSKDSIIFSLKIGLEIKS